MSAVATRTYRCALCNRRLRDERWIYSRHSGNRYCFPGECHRRAGKKGKR